MTYRAGFVALMGRPNVGKSSLLNALLGAKVAMTTDKPQTTRNAIRGILHGADAQLVLVDTPGIHRAQTKLSERMVKTARAEAHGVDSLWHIVDISRPPRVEDGWAADLCVASGVPVWLIANKADLVTKPESRLPAYLELAAYARRFMVSAKTESGLPGLVATALAELPEGDPFFPEEMVTDQPEDFYVSETVREQVLLATRDEVPHAVAVLTEERIRRSPQLMYIRAVIYVERESQKAIVIGEGGRMLRQIGQAARRELEQYYGHAVFLDLWVKVRRRWREEEDWLRRFGYPMPQKS